MGYNGNMCSVLKPQESGLVLEGGGLRGNYTAGVLDAFLDEGIDFPYVIGVSSGAAMGSSYVSRQRGRNFQLLDKYHGDPRFFSFRNLILKGSIFNMDFVFNQIPNKYIIFDFKTFIESPTRFVSVCTDCKTGEPEYLEKYAGMEAAEFFKTLEASSSMPYTSNIVKFKGKMYLDGAVSDALPLKKAQSEGYKQNVVVLTNPAGFRKKEEPHPPNGLLYFGKKALIKSLKMRVTRYNEILEYVEAQEKAGTAIVIRPSVDLKAGRVEKDKQKLLRLYELGISDAKAMLKKYGLSK
jgi:predicted patatin/cPLA2 family phospholipase